MTNRKPYATFTIPEDIQSNWRHRLRIVREHKGFYLDRVKSVSSGTLRTYELENISTLTIGNLYAYANELDISFSELINIIIGEAPLEEQNKQYKRLALYYNTLSPENKDTAIAIMRVLIDRQEEGVPRLPVFNTKENKAVATKA